MMVTYNDILLKQKALKRVMFSELL